ncbi:MAG TPA: SDR family oxidoreductase [Paracoccus sp.]|nr:SDR family oxidoreductase [Paracoccus sp. (in: a-proteobacteria)]
MNGRVQDRTALVMGAGSVGPGWGNGKAIAVTLARQGARVMCVDRNRAAAEETAALIAAEGGIAAAHVADATSSDQVEAVRDACVDRFGSIDILVNNIGIAPVGGVVELSVEDWDRVFDINLKTCFLGMKHVIPQMLAQGRGAIVNISSVASLRWSGVAYAGYYSTKAAMNHLTRTTAVEYAARGIRINAVLPGLMRTPMVENSGALAQDYGDGDVGAMWRKRDAQVPMGHMGDAWDVANATLFLASDEARYITGIELVVDGGVTLKFA